jgi:hypothetical protein
MTCRPGSDRPPRIRYRTWPDLANRSLVTANGWITMLGRRA